MGEVKDLLVQKRQVKKGSQLSTSELACFQHLIIETPPPEIQSTSATRVRPLLQLHIARLRDCFINHQHDEVAYVQPEMRGLLATVAGELLPAGVGVFSKDSGALNVQYTTVLFSEGGALRHRSMVKPTSC